MLVQLSEEEEEEEYYANFHLGVKNYSLLSLFLFERVEIRSRNWIHGPIAVCVSFLTRCSHLCDKTNNDTEKREEEYYAKPEKYYYKQK